MTDGTPSPSATPQPEPAILLEEGRSMLVDAILKLLSTGTVREERGRLRWSSNYTFLVSVQEGDECIKAIYKPRRGERPLWDFPDGTLCNRERAAYLLSETLGWRIVPPTVLRGGQHDFGSFQLHIQHNPETNYFNLSESYVPQLKQMAVFDTITNNADRKGGHCLVGPGGKLWGIDHGICFHHAMKLRTVIWDFAGQQIPESILSDVEKLLTVYEDPESELRTSLDNLLSPREIDAMRLRIERLLREQRFPQPRHGPCYPWPPV